MLLFHQKGEFFFDTQPENKNYTLFIFRGDTTFLQNSKIWCEASEVIKPDKFHFYDEHTGFCRVDYNELKSAIAKSFEYEVLQEKDALIKYTKRVIEEEGKPFEIIIDWDQKAVEKIAWAKMQEFLDQKVSIRKILKNLYFNLDRANPDGYNLGEINGGMES